MYKSIRRRAKTLKTLFSIVLLISCSSALALDRLPPVFLNHVWIALDQATYDALRTSGEVAELGGVNEQKVVAGDQSWSGFYWTGRQTYMEFFGAAALPEDTAVGDCGIGLFVETPGAVPVLAEHLRSGFGDDVATDKQVRTTAAGEIPWYTAVHLKESASTAVWVMELDPGYLAARHPEAAVKDPLSRQQEGAWDYRINQNLDNIVGLTVALDQEKTSELATELGLLGWSVRRTAAGFQAYGPEIAIRVVRAHDRTGIQRIDLHLRRSVPRQTIQLGNAKLRLVGDSGALVLWN
ncbi:MAG: hypothetical protein JSS29_10970 [Proteobacteria bacterium]|nr:hypothetical protein [Pseudomonadota bacterium]